MSDATTRKLIDLIPACSIKAGPRSTEWKNRLKEEYIALIKLVNYNRENQQEWFKIDSNPDGTKWTGVCWHLHNLVKYEFDLQFEIPATYPSAPIELELPELDGKTPKMYRGGKICLDVHFAPLWQKNTPKYGIAHSLALGLGPWLAAEIPFLVDTGVLDQN